jgi:tetratricopeptide (TPR) repeat protein
VERLAHWLQRTDITCLVHFAEEYPVNDLQKADPIAEVNMLAHRIISGAVLALALILYFATMAPTTSFWDCGEFIACSYSMGVPHPPGAPFYLLLGRMFSLFMPLPDIGMRINSLSVILSAVTVLFTYLIVVRLVRRWRGPEVSTSDKWVLYGSGVTAALAFAFSHSFWFNAVEAEVYAISMFFTALVFWLAVRWMDFSKDISATKYLLLVSFYVGVAIGIHLLNVLALSPIIMLIYFQKYKFSWKGFIFAMLISMAAILVVYPGVVAGVPKLLGASIFLKILVLAGILGSTIWAIRQRRNLMAILLASLVLVLIGYSTYAVVYIRSNLNPVINENQPDTVDRLISYLNREQYGAVGPVAMEKYSASTIRRLQDSGAAMIPLGGGNVLRLHILERAAPFWEYQINQMYIRYLSWQYFISEEEKPLIFPFLFGLMGMIWHYWRDPKRAFSVSLLFLMTGLAIIFYLNQDNPQPRERDYAYVGSFFAFSLWIGMGVAAFYEFFEDMIRNKGVGLKKVVAYGTVIASLVVVPLNMVLANYDSHSRAGNFVAWDYSRNMLETAEKDGIIFTNGDNDTFPLWYLQVVEGIRTDVRVANLSLLNTNWYIKQLRDEYPTVPISLSDRQVDERLTGISDDALLSRYWPADMQNWSMRTARGDTMAWRVPATMHIPTGMPGEKPGEPNFLRVQDIMILHILEQNRWERPIYFAVTVSNTNLVGLDPYMTMEGLLFRVHDDQVPEINEPVLRQNLFETYKPHYRNLDNPDVHYFGNVIKLLQNYRSGFLQLVYTYYRDSERGTVRTPSGIPDEQWDERFEELSSAEKALHTLRKMDEYLTLDSVPQTNRDVALQIGRIYYDLGDSTNGMMYFEHALDLFGDDITASLQVAYYIGEYSGEKERAGVIVHEVLDKQQTVETLFGAAAIFERLEMFADLRGVLTTLREKSDLSVQDQLDLGTFYFTLKEWHEAATIYEELAAELPDNGEVFGSLLTAYQQSNDSAMVQSTLERWLSRNPTDSEAARLLQEWGGTVPEGITISDAPLRDH